jgi:hypothetical protein
MGVQRSKMKCQKNVTLRLARGEKEGQREIESRNEIPIWVLKGRDINRDCISKT